MFDRQPASSAPRRRPCARALRAAVLVLLAALGMPAALPVQAADNPSGLALPRFATTRSTPINVRVGPGTRYGIAWVYVKAGTPVEIIQEFDTWRKIRDVDGSEGWVHQNMLSGKRAGIAAPWNGGESRIPLLSHKGGTEGVRAYLGPASASTSAAATAPGARSGPRPSRQRRRHLFRLPVPDRPLGRLRGRDLQLRRWRRAGQTSFLTRTTTSTWVTFVPLGGLGRFWMVMAEAGMSITRCSSSR